MDGVTNVSRREAMVVKRRHSREVNIPTDVTNLPEGQYLGLKVTRRHSRVSAAAVNTVASTQAARAGNSSSSSQLNSSAVCEPENQMAQPARAAKIAAMAKLKAWRGRTFSTAASSPRAHGRKKKNKSAASLSKSSTDAAGQQSLDEVPMDVDDAVLGLGLELTQQVLNVTSVPDCVPDIDNHDDYFLAPEYAQDIVRYMQMREKETLLSPDLVCNNTEVSAQMRAVLIDWLIQVQVYEELEEETLQLTVALTDQYLARVHVKMQFVQLLGITCLFIAAKYVERFPPTVTTLNSLTVTYTERQILQMERNVLRVLGFEVGLPVPDFFLKRFFYVHKHCAQERHLSNYLLDLSMPSILLVAVAPSVRAASALYLARRVWLPEESEAWSPALQFYTGHAYSDLQPTVRIMSKMLLRAPVSRYQAARQKFANSALYGAISLEPLLDNHPAVYQLAVLDDPDSDLPA